MKNSNVARIIALILAAVILVSGLAVTVMQLISKDTIDNTISSEVSNDSSALSSEPESSEESEPESAPSSEAQEEGFTLEQLYSANIAGNILELSGASSVKTTVTLYFPDETDFWYTRYLERDEAGEYHFHYIDQDGQEESIRRNSIFMTQDGSSIQFQVAYDAEFETDIIPYITSGNAYYYEPTEEIRSCVKDGGKYIMETGIDMAQDAYYANNWGYTEGIADCKYVIDAETLMIESIQLTFDGKTMMETTVVLGGADADSPMMSSILINETVKNITVYYDYGGTEEKTYVYSVPGNAAFYYSQPDGFTMYVDSEGTEPMAEASAEDERLSADSVFLYLIRNPEEESSSEG